MIKKNPWIAAPSFVNKFRLPTYYIDLHKSILSLGYYTIYTHVVIMYN